MSEAMTRENRVTLVGGPGAIIAALDQLQVSTVNPEDLPTGASRAAQYLATAGPDTVLFGPDVPTETALAVAGELDQSFPEVDVVIVASPTRQLLLDAMKHGVREVVDSDAGIDVIGATVSRVTVGAGLRRTRLAGPSEDTPSEDGTIISVMAAKGGVGKTTVAVNLAVELARSAPNDVVLIDLDLVAGDADALLGLNPDSTVATVAGPGGYLDKTVVKLSLTSHRSGLLLLAAPDGLVEADSVDPGLLAQLLELLRPSFKYIVVDTAPGAGAPLASAVEVTDHLLAIATPDLGGLRSLRRNLDGLETLGLNRARRHLVLNRSAGRYGIGRETIENSVGLEIRHTIEETDDVTAAANQGVPYVDAYPRGDAVRSFRELAADFGAEVAAEPVPTPARRSAGNPRGRAA